MADVAYWESRFVSLYIVKPKQERYRFLLKGRKHRKKLLDRLNHSLDIDLANAEILDSSAKDAETLLALLGKHHVSPTAYLIADGSEKDSQEIRLDKGAEELLDNHFGAVLICPPKPVAVYKPEDPGGMYLLSPRIGPSARERENDAVDRGSS